MYKFIAGLLLGLTLAQVDSKYVLRKVTLEMETMPTPTGTIRHWSFLHTGGVCSADVSSTFGKMMLELQNAGNVDIHFTLHEPLFLKEIKR